MKEELIYTILDLEEWNQRTTCDFCPDLNKSVCQIRTRNKVSGEIVENDMVCENCKEKFENDEILKCEDCGRLKNETNVHALSGKYICKCVRNNESKEKEIPLLPHQKGGMVVFYETQINKLREEKTAAEITIEEERGAHEDFMRVSEEWSKRQKQELLDRIKELETEVERLKKQTPQALVDEIESNKKEIESLKNRLEQQTAQIEVKETKKWPWKLRK